MGDKCCPPNLRVSNIVAEGWSYFGLRILLPIKIQLLEIENKIRKSTPPQYIYNG
jgi:hypothetical protein